jgi:nucleotide-binding universal stress UspA family protein
VNTKTVVVAYDGSRGAKAAASWALDEAVREQAAVEFLYVLEWPTYAAAASLAPAPYRWSDTDAERRAESLLEEARAAAEVSHPELELRTTALHGGAAAALCDRSRTASMLVLGSRGHGGWSALVIGSVSLAVTTHAHCPVVVVRGVTPDPFAQRRAIVVGVDGSPCADVALGFAYDQAAERGVPLKVIRAWQPFPTWDGEVPDEDAVYDDERAEVEALLTGWRAKYPSVLVHTEIVLDHPGRALVAASGTAQLVVVGSRGRGGLRGLLLGSVSQQLLHHAKCPVAVVRDLGCAVSVC